MPRKARIDMPGALHHIIVRGIERRRIFYDDLDRRNFIERFGIVLTESDTPPFCLGPDSQSFAFAIEDRDDAAGHGDATAFDRVCRKL